MKVSSKFALAGIICAIGAVALVAGCAKKEAPVEPMPAVEAPVAVDTNTPVEVAAPTVPAEAPAEAPAAK